jgi:NADPH:quinone reductase
VGSRHSWGVAAVALTLILVALGTGIGLSSVSPWSSSNPSATTFTLLAAVWLVIVQWLSSGLGGYLAYVPGMEAAGIVDEVGSGVPDRLKVGDAVMAIVVPKGSHGAYREQIVLDARSVVRAPTGKTHPEACSLPMNGLTARQSLDLLKLSPGQVIAVIGAAGAYGGYVVQLAKAEGLTVIADASEKDEKLVASLGADIVVRRGDDVALRIRRHFPQGVDGLADGAVLNELVIPAVRDGGAFTSVRGFQGIPQRDIHFTATFVRSYAQEFEKLDRLRQQVEAGKITLRVAEVYPPERAADAHRRLEAGGTRGRLVIQF